MSDPEADARASAENTTDLERLRRIAFGRTSTDAEVAAAAAARLRLAQLEAAASLEAAREQQRRAAAEREALQRASAREATGVAHPLDGDDDHAGGHPGGNPAAGSGDPGDYPGDDTDAPARTARRRAWLLPAAAGVLVGAVLGGGALWLARPAPVEPPAVSASQDPSDGGINYFLGEPTETLPPGDVEAALAWFSRVQTEEDLVGVPELRSEFDRNSVRLVHSAPAARVWIARQTDGKICLETTATATQITNGSCVDPEEFARDALRVDSAVLTAAWTGSQLSVVQSLG